MMIQKEIIIIGGGVSGLGMACQLQRLLGHSNFTIYEKSSNVGGTWWHNTYPGCACDIPSHFYSYSFAIKPDWTTTYPERDELHSYIMSVVKRYDLLRRTVLNTELVEAQWISQKNIWSCTFRNVNNGKTFIREAAVLVSAVGTLDKPSTPHIPGLGDFKGESFHSARWQHDVDMKDKNVVVIGNGASATQFITPLVAQVGSRGSVTQIVRGAHWWIKRGNPPYSKLFQMFMKYVPGAAKFYRCYIAWDLDRVFFSFYMTSSGKRLRDQITSLTQSYIEDEAPEKYKSILLPNYEPGCKRRVNTNTYLRTLHEPNMNLVKETVIQVDAKSIATKEGHSYPADILIFATGFETQEWLFPMHIRGLGGNDLAENWRRLGGAEAYKGTCVNGFPNFFILYGPNAATGQHSVIFHSECQINYACRVMRPVVTNRADSIMPRAEAQKRDLQWVHGKLQSLVFNSGCQSWWMNPVSKKNTFIYPDLMVLYWLRTIFPIWKDFEIRGRRSRSLMELFPLVVTISMCGMGALYVYSKLFLSGAIQKHYRSMLEL